MARDPSSVAAAQPLITADRRVSERVTLKLSTFSILLIYIFCNVYIFLHSSRSFQSLFTFSHLETREQAFVKLSRL